MQILLPTTLEEALEYKSRMPNARWIAGATDLMPFWHATKELPEYAISLRNLQDLNTISIEGELVSIGGAVTHSQIYENELILERFPAIAKAAKSIGAPAIRNMGTIGGNIANGSPSADLPPALMVYDAVVVLRSAKGSRKVALDELYEDYRKLDIKEDELICSIEIPLPANDISDWFVKVGTRKSQSISKASLAGVLQLSSDNQISHVRLAAGSVAPTPVRLYKTESLLLGNSLDVKLIEHAAQTAQSEVSPIDDIRSTAKYRRHVIGVLVKRFLESQLGNV